MNKTVQIFIAIDDVPLEELDELLNKIDSAIAKYPDKRVQTSIQDEPMVRR